MAAKRKQGWIAAFVLMGAGVATFQHLSGERPLLSRARLVVPASQAGGGQYHWLSDKELLFARGWVSSQFHMGFFRVNSTSGLLRHVPMLSAQMPRANFEEIHVSPAGEWLFSGTVEEKMPNRPSLRFYYLGRTDGTQIRRQVIGKGFLEKRWLEDGRRWVEFYGKYVASSGNPGNETKPPIAFPQIQQIHVCNVDTPGHILTLKIPSSSLLREPGIIQSLFAVSPDRFLTWKQTAYPPDAQVILREMGWQSIAPLHQYTVRLPPGRWAVQLVFNPHGDRILWKLHEPLAAGAGLLWLHRIFPAVKANRIDRVSLWVSRKDGSGMYEIGGVNNPEQDYFSGPIDTETGEHFWGPPIPRNIQWMPDGKSLSFMYKSALWSTPAD